MEKEKKKVPIRSFILQIYVLIISLILPIITYKSVQLKIPSSKSLKSFITGNITFFTFALILEQILHFITLKIFPNLKDNMILFGIYGGLAAGLFEEIGRLFSFTFILNSPEIRNNNINCVYYGIGHGGIEIWMIVTLTYVNNIIFSLKINNETIYKDLEKIDNENKKVMYENIDKIIDLDIVTCFACLYERGMALIIHVANSIIVWYGIKNNNILFMLLIAIFNHAIANSLTVILYMNLKKSQLSKEIQYFFIYCNLTLITSCIVVFSLYYCGKSNYVLEVVKFIQKNIKGDL